MEQLHIYDYLGVTNDPLFNKIKQLKKGQSVIFKEIKILLNDYGIYEVSTEEKHEGFSDASTCYRGLIESDRAISIEQ